MKARTTNAKVATSQGDKTPSGVTVREDGLNKLTIRLDYQATLDFYKYLELRKATTDLVLGLTPIGQEAKAIEYLF